MIYANLSSFIKSNYYSTSYSNSNSLINSLSDDINDGIMLLPLKGYTNNSLDKSSSKDKPLTYFRKPFRSSKSKSKPKPNHMCNSI